MRDGCGVPLRALRAFMVLLLTLLPRVATAVQHEHMPGMDMGESRMPVAPFGVSMNRMGSGTTWIPDALTLPSAERMAGGWHLVAHAFAFGQYDTQAGPRGGDQVGGLNWAMLMASHTLAGGRVQGRAMLSLDALTVGTRGYPLLLQNGESVDGVPLVDRQHPHDFWMELGAMYERAMTSSVGLMLYAAAAGEPALGPVAFMHRPSAMDDPFAPIVHHWQDATHIQFGVLTAGVFGRTWRLEGSRFNGREPDQHRWGFDFRRLDSYSARLTVNPDSSWSFTAGWGHLASHEVLNPAESTDRMVVSAMHGRRLAGHGQWSTTVVWGANVHSGTTSHSLLGESALMLDDGTTLFGRAEVVQKSAEDLRVTTSPPETRFTVLALSVGGLREIAQWGGANLGLGVRGTINRVPAGLAAAYGSRTPLGLAAFLRLRPIHRPVLP